MPWFCERATEIGWRRLRALIEQTVAEARRRICARPRRVLLLPPDLTRMHSGAGRLTEWFYELLSADAVVNVIPTLGQHVPHTPDDNRRMFGAIPNERIHTHDWRGGCVRVGEIPAERVRHATGGAADWPIPVVLNRMLIEESWDLIINIGHVVPHEVLGFANHNKNYFIGLGGKETICASHMAAACCGIENNLGRLVTPLRALFNWAEEEFLARLPDVFVQVVMAERKGSGVGDWGLETLDPPLTQTPDPSPQSLIHTGLYVGDDVETYLAAARQSQEENITLFDEPVGKIVCLMQGDEFHSTWVANKAVYRTRLALANRGELVIIAPGLVRFGEQPEVDMLIRRYGYCGTPRVMGAYKVSGVGCQVSGNSDTRHPTPDTSLREYAHAAAHLMHGSTEGRFRVRYAPGGLTQEEIEGVGYEYEDLSAAIARYRLDDCRPGWNKTSDGEPFYFIPTPSAGLWVTKARMLSRQSPDSDLL